MNKKVIIPVCIIAFVLVITYCIHVGILLDRGTEDAFVMAFPHMFTAPLDIFPFPTKAIFFMLAFICMVVLIFWYTKTLYRKSYHDQDNVQGRAHYMNDKDVEKFVTKYAEPLGKPGFNSPNNIILTKFLQLSLDNQKTGRNLNVLVDGGSGAGKSFKLIIPNILQANTSFLITDPSGELVAQYGAFLEGRGYRVVVFDLDEPSKSAHFNPLWNIDETYETEKNIALLVDMIIQNTSDPNQKGGDEFWTQSTRILMTACIGYLIRGTEKRLRTFANMMYLMRQALETPEGDSSGASNLDLLFKRYEKGDEAKKIPGHGEDTYVKMYQKFKAAADKTLQNIMISAFARLQMFDQTDISELTSTDDIHIDSFGDEKTALFVKIPTGERTYNFLAGILYSQFFQRGYAYCQRKARYTQVVMDAEDQVWKCFRADTISESKTEANALAKAWLERAKKATVVYEPKMRWWEARTEIGELVGHRRTKEMMESALAKLKSGGHVIYNGDRGNGRFPIHVQLLLDEFRNTGQIPGFDERISTMRKFAMSAIVVLQSTAQLKTLYKDEWETIISNCDALLFMGSGVDASTMEWMTKFTGKETRVATSESVSAEGKGSTNYQKVAVELLTPYEMLTQDENDCVLIFRGLRPYCGKKALAVEHPNWKEAKDIRDNEGAYIYSQAKGDYLRKESSVETRAITDIHGPVIQEPKEEKDQKNADGKQFKGEYRENKDIDGKPIIGKRQPMKEMSMDLDETLDDETLAYEIVEATIDLCEDLWGKGKFRYEAVVAGLS